jgi:hypothetical protein
VHGETATADGARDFLKSVVRSSGTAGQAKDPGAGVIGRVNQADEPLGCSFFRHTCRIANAALSLDAPREIHNMARDDTL